MNNVPLRRFCMLLAALSAHGTLRSSEPEVAYRETFPAHRDPSRHIRIAAASKNWEVVEEDGRRFLRVTVTPAPGNLRGLVVWDLAPVQFNALAVRARVNGTGGAPVFLEFAANDRAGNGYVFRPFGESKESAPRIPLPSDGSWAELKIAIPGDLVKIFTKGREISPYVHGRGEALTTWESTDFSNIGYCTLYFHADVPKDSPLIGKSFTVDLDGLELSNAR